MKTGMLMGGDNCHNCAYCYERKSGLGTSYWVTVSYTPMIKIEYTFYIHNNAPKRVFIIDTVLRDPRNVLQATEIEYGTCSDTVSTRQLVLRYDTARYDLYWVVDGLVIKNEQVNRVNRRQLFEEGIIREEDIYFDGKFVQKVQYPK